MKINLNQEGFNKKTEIIAGEEVYLFTPPLDFNNWTKENVIFRSSVWNKDGEPVSLGFKKFFNLFERPEVLGEPDFNKPFKVVEKCDGNCVLVSLYKGELIVRTRGTLDIREKANGREVREWVESRPLITSFLSKYNCTLAFEVCDPKTRIIVKHDKFNLILLNIINHKDYSYYTQEEVDLMAEILYLDRPKVYNSSINKENSRHSLVKWAKTQENIEGYCVYFNNDQNICKLKTDWYLKANYAKNGIRKFTILEDFVASGVRDRAEFIEFYSQKFDFELLEFLDVDWLFVANEILQERISQAVNFAEGIKEMDKKARAAAVAENLPKGLHSFVFEYLSYGAISNETKVKRLKEICKKDLL